MNDGLPTLRTLDECSLIDGEHVDFACFYWLVRQHEAKFSRTRLDTESMYYSGDRPLDP